MTPPMTQKEIREEFERFWGEAPKLSAKYNAREKAADFFLSHHTKVLEEIEGEMTKLKNTTIVTDKILAENAVIDTALEIIKKYR
jgi:hypothetical protein